jgi:hypothetical protein
MESDGAEEADDASRVARHQQFKRVDFGCYTSANFKEVNGLAVNG